MSIKLLITLTLMTITSTLMAFMNVAYVEVNDNPLSSVGCYVFSENNKPFFDVAAIFAANINGANPDTAYIYLNPLVDNVLNHSNEIKNLQQQGIKILLTIMGNHQNAGWSCFQNDEQARNFADKVVDVVQKYKLDGIDVNDEYSNCSPSYTSLIQVTRAIKTHPGFKGKLLTKPLFRDKSYFASHDKNNKLADFLDFSWEMTYHYAGADKRLSPYHSLGLGKNQLLLGLQSNIYKKEEAWIRETMSQGYGGMMIFNVNNHMQTALSKIAEAEYGWHVEKSSTC